MRFRLVFKFTGNEKTYHGDTEARRKPEGIGCKFAQISFSARRARLPIARRFNGG